MKTCTKCKAQKVFFEFSKNKAQKDGYHSQCKSCAKEYLKQYIENNKEKIKEKEKQYREKNKEKEKERNKKYIKNNKNKIKEYRKEYAKKYYKKNKEKIIEYNKDYRKNNKEKFKELYKKYRKNNKEKFKDYHKEYVTNRRKIDPLFKLSHNIRNLINKSIKNKGFTKRSQTYKILGCTYEEFKIHLENQFTDGMTWENQGKWHLDHIYPVSLAKNEEELIKLNHYTNFQPLWAEDNLKKSNKII